MRVVTKVYPTDMEYLTLYPIGDVHYGAAECMERDFGDYLKRIEQDDTAAVVILGDLINNGIRSSVTNCFEEVHTPREQKLGMLDMLHTVRHKIVAGVRGNHEYRTVKDADIDIMEDIFRELDLGGCYMRNAGILKVSVGQKYNRKPATYSFYINHGQGGGITIAGGINRQNSMQLSVEGVDGILSGHTHKPSKIPSGRLIFDSRNNKVTHANTLIYVCTAWMEYGGYAEKAVMPPVAFLPRNGGSKWLIAERL